MDGYKSKSVSTAYIDMLQFVSTNGSKFNNIVSIALYNWS